MGGNDPRDRSRAYKRPAFVVAAVYAVFGGLWILLSDRLLLAAAPDEAFYHSFQTYKGWLYVTVTAALLYVLVRGELERIRRLEEEKRAGELKLLQAQKTELLGRLAGGIAHDFNNILAAISGLADSAARSLPAGDQRRTDMEDISRFADKASGLTRQLLIFGRRQEVRPRPLDLREVFAGTVNMLKQAAGKAVRLEFMAPDGLWPVLADPLQLDQVFMNLTVNARDAMPAGGTLEFSVCNAELERKTGGPVPRAGRYVALAARDTGTGMDRETLAKLFEPFFTTKPEGKGTGLGLSVVRSIVEEAGGSVAVEREPGKGTVFTLYFPAAEISEPSEKQTARV